MSHYKPYPAYRDSGVEWIGEVPEHWGVIRLAMVGSLMKANGGNKQDDADTGVPCIRYGDIYTTYDLQIHNIKKFINQEAEPDYTSVQYGDILFAASGETFEEIGKSAVNLSQSSTCCGGDIIILRPQPKFNPIFLAYATSSSSAQSQKSIMGKGFTVIHIYGDQLRNVVIALPSEQEQKLIGNRIDRETTRIDALISKKTRFIELLKEKRTALITHAVTKGLDPKSKMKDSGVAWIGEVPDHWQVARIKRAAFLRNERRNDAPRGQVYIGLEDVESCTGKYSPTTGSSRQSEESTVGTFQDGDILYGKLRPYLRKAIVTGDAGICSTEFLVLQPKTVLSNWLHKWLLTTEVTQQIEAGCYGAKMPRADWEHVGSIHIPVPLLEEQRLIISALEKFISRIDLLCEKTQHSIDLLKERRSALITDAVTGKIDLRNQSEY